MNKRLTIRIVGLVLLLGPSVLRAADLVPFVIEWPADVSFLLHSPAGKDGFVRVENGHLMTGKKRLRLWGVTFTAAARFENTEMVWNDRRTTLQAWGKEPTRIEPVVGRLILRALEGAKAVQVVALDGAGRPLGESLAAAPEGGHWVFTLGRSATTWYLVTVKRGRTFQEPK